MSPKDEVLPEKATRGSDPEEFQAGREVVSSLLVALRIHALYPEEHAICRKAMVHIRTQLEGFFQLFGDLRLEVERTGFRLGAEAVHQGPADEGNPAFVLFRDGIQWVVFEEEVTLWEIAEFIRLLNRYRTSSEDAEGDLVTGLWEAQLPHLLYGAADPLWEEGAVEALPEEAGEEVENHAEGPTPELGPGMIPPLGVAREWKGEWLELTPAEEMQLQQMVVEEESRDFTDAMLEMLVDLVREDEEKEDLESVFSFLEEEFQNALAQGGFHLARKILQRVHVIRDVIEEGRRWGASALQQIVHTAWSPSSMKAVQEHWATIGAPQVEEIRQIFLLLPPEAIAALGSLLPKAPSARFQRMLADVICTLASRDLEPLVSLMMHADEELLHRLVYVLGQMEGERPTRLLLEKARHPSERVRREAVKALLVRGQWVFREIFPLIDDESEAIRRMLLEHLGWRRSDVAEGLLLD